MVVWIIPFDVMICSIVLMAAMNSIVVSIVAITQPFMKVYDYDWEVAFTK